MISVGWAFDQIWLAQGNNLGPGDVYVGGTFMHELGHNLGLRHGGLDELRYKPNLLSVMNYAFQTEGLRRFVPSVPSLSSTFGLTGTRLPQLGILDFSRFGLESIEAIDETSGIDETVPIARAGSVAAEYGSYYFGPDEGEKKTLYIKKAAPTPIARLGLPVDWDKKDGSGFATDINVNGDNSVLLGGWPKKDKLEPVNEWRMLVFDGGAIGSRGRLADIESEVAESVERTAIGRRRTIGDVPRAWRH